MLALSLMAKPLLMFVLGACNGAASANGPMATRR